MIPAVLGDAGSLIKRFQKAQGRRSHWENLWRKAYEYAIPDKEVFTIQEKGGQRNEQVYDETAVKAVPKFATRIMAALVPTWAQWAKLVPGGIIDDDTKLTIPDEFEHLFEGTEADEVLEEYTEKVFHYIHHSNFSSQAFESFQDLSITNGALLCEADPVNVIRFRAEPISNLFLECGPDGAYETTWRHMKIKGRDILRHWPDAKLGEELDREVKDKPDDEHVIIEGVVFEPVGGDYHLVVIHEKKKKDLYYENKGPSNPWIISSWSRAPGEIYSRGPVLSVLPAILSLNKIWEFVLQNAAFKTVGAWTGVSDGVWNPYNITIAPGTIIPVGSNDNGNPTLRELPVGGDLQYIDWLINQKQTQVEQALFANPMGDVDDSPVRTLGENMLRVQDMLEQAGASMSLLETEVSAKVLKRVIFLLVEAGKLPELKVDGEAITIKMQSPLAQARDAQSLEALGLFFNAVAPLGPEVTAAKSNVHEIFEMAAKHAGLPAATVNSQEEFEDNLRQVSEAVGQQEQL